MTLLSAFVWVPVAAAGVVAAAFLLRSDGRPAWARSLGAAQLAGLVLLALWGALRGFDWLSSGGGPMSWVGVTRDVATSAAPLDKALLRLGIGAGLVFAFGVLVISRLRARRAPRMPLAIVAVVVAALAAVLVGGVYASDPVAFAAAMPLDLAAVTPVFAASTALAFVRVPASPAAVAAPVAAEDLAADGDAAPAASGTGRRADPVAWLQKMKLLDGTATFQVSGNPPVGEPASAGDRIWQACGGLGTAAGCITIALDRIDQRAPGVMVGDLSAPTEEVVGDAMIAGALYRHASRVVVLCQRPEAERDRLRAVLERLGAPAPGPLVAGEGELRDVLAKNLLPAAVWLDLDDLGTAILGATSQRNKPWLRGIDLIVLLGVDRLQPIGATHMAFALRRLTLALGEHRVTPAWAALGGGSSGSLRFVEESTMTRFEPTPLGAPATSPVRVYVRPIGGEGGSTELEARARGLAGSNVVVALEDAIGGDPDRRPGYHGDVSLAQIEDRHLAGLYLARNNLAHDVEAPGGHLGVWWVHDTPLARFLLHENALAGLEQRGELQTPRPVAGLENPYLAAAHLEAALREGRPDEAALRRAFGDGPVEQLVRAGDEADSAGQRARFDPVERTIERSRLLAASGARGPDLRRETITASFIEVKSSRSGEILARVDRRAAPTRFYPHRVFRAGDALYQVGGDPIATNASNLIVKPAPASASATLPALELEIVETTWRGSPKQVQMGKLKFARGVADVKLRESVTGAIPRDKGTASVKYPPVTVEYPSRAVVILFADKPSAKALRYAGAMSARLVSAHLLVEPEDVDAVAYPAGFGNVARPALVFVDRHLGGVGVADALDAATVHNLFRWTWGILYRCPCMNGCDKCTPPDVLAAGTDKVGALKLLGG